MWLCSADSVNSVTFTAVHGPPLWCVSATGAGYHNRNLIQPFYSPEETRCIPSSRRHCLNIHVLLCNKSHALSHVSMHTFSFLMMMMMLMDWETPELFHCIRAFNSLQPSQKSTLSLLICRARDFIRTPIFLKMMRCLIGVTMATGTHRRQCSALISSWQQLGTEQEFPFCVDDVSKRDKRATVCYF